MSAKIAKRELLTANDTMKLMGWKSRSTIRNALDTIGFPHPLKLPNGRLYWRAEEIDAWLEAQPRAA
jgi:predicted DNA-binding transcriptional regulator AlpA